MKKACVKCGKMLARPREKHDCKQIRMSAAAGVTSEVERMLQKNRVALKSAGNRGGEPPQGTTEPHTGSQVV